MKQPIALFKHDNRDMGWNFFKPNGEAHYWRSNPKSQSAISHCMLVLTKDDLYTSNGNKRCHLCATVENMRDEMDGKNG